MRIVILPVNICNSCKGDLHCFGDKAINQDQECNCNDCLIYLKCEELQE